MNNIKLICFDLDGVLVDTKPLHFTALNMALESIDPAYSISIEEHLKIYDGLPTRDKLVLLTKNKGLPEDTYDTVWELKQKFTQQAIMKEVSPNKELIDLMTSLKVNGYMLACCSNSIRETVFLILSELQILKYFDGVYSNNSVSNPKPHPEIYWKAMCDLKVYPDQTLILEDSPPGIMAASKSGAHILQINSLQDVSKQNVY